MGERLLDTEGRPIPGFYVKKKGGPRRDFIISGGAWTIIVLALVGLWGLTVYGFMLGLNWIFNTGMFTFWKTALLILFLSLFGGIRMTLEKK